MELMKKNMYQSNIVISTNYDTGEIVESQETQITKKYVEPAYIKLYLNDLLVFMNVPRGLTKILCAFIQIVDYKGELVLNATIKRDIASQLAISVNSIHAAITVFVKQKVLYRRGTGTYLLNPYLAAKGNWKDISKIRMDIEYNQEQLKVIKNVEFYRNVIDE